MISELLQHRGLLRDMVRRDLKHRFAGSALGLWWHLVQPVLLMLLFYFVFAHLIAARLGTGSPPAAYAIYLCSGMLPWFAVQETMVRAGNLFQENAAVVRRIAFPPILLVAQLVVSSMLVTGGVVLVLAVSLVALGGIPVAGLGSLPAALALLLLLLTGLALSVSVVAVFMRDLVPLLPVAASLWFWLTPIVYTPDILPAPLALLLRLNPFVPVLDLFRTAAGLPVALGPSGTGSAGAMVVLMLLAGVGLFRGLARDVADEV